MAKITYTIILEVPEDLEFHALDENGDYVIGNDVAYEISQLGADWPPHRMPGTLPVNGKKLILAAIDTTATDPLSMIQALIITFDLTWQIFGFKTFQAINEIVDGEFVRYEPIEYLPLQDDILPYLDELPEDQPPIYDEDGNIIDYEPIDFRTVSRLDGECKWLSQ